MNETLTKVFQRDIGALAPVRIAVSTPETRESQEFELLHPYGIVGRSPNCDIRLKNEKVSFRHAYLQMICGQLFCADLGSRLGTHWGSDLQRSGWLTAEEAVAIGPYALQLANEPTLDSADFPAIPPDFDPLAIYRDELGPLPQVRLEFLNAADNVDLPIRRMLTFAGSSRGCKLRFEGDRISRVHCSLLLTSHGLWVIDLLGKGGTKVNGSLVRSDRLNDGDVLKVGQFQMRIRYEGSAGTPITSDVLPAETTVETSSSTDEELSTAPRQADVIPHPTIFELTHDTGEATPCGHLIDKIVANKLLTREEIDEVLAEFEDGPPTFDALSERLVARELLSQWQADQLATDNHGPLILENRYKIIERLGYGSMGIVYRAFDEALQSDVALKIPHNSSLKNERLFKRFRRETLISANLVHPQVVRALNIGRGNRFVVLELVDGDDLRDLIDRQGPPGEAMAVDFMIQVAEAVDFAWREGVVHRDIKPSNILVSREGTAKLFDFGLAHLDEAALTKGVAGKEAELIPTRPGFAVGTVQYMSPEQGEESDEVDCRSDIYSLGCTLYEILTGAPPFEGDSQHEILRQHAQDPVAPIEGLESGLAAILDRMLQKDPDQRYQSPRELIDSLHQWRTATETATNPNSISADQVAADVPTLDDQVQEFHRQREQWQQCVDADGLELAQQREELQAERDRQSRQWDEQQADLERQQQELEQGRQALEELQAECEQRESALALQIEELESLQEQTAENQQRLTEDLESLKSQQQQAADEQQRFESERSELDQALAKLDGDRGELSQQQQTLAAERQQLESRLAEFQSSLTAHEASALQVTQQNDELAEQARALELTAETLERAQAELDTRQAKLESAEAALAGERQALEQSRAESAAEKSRLQDSQAQLETAQAELAQQQAGLEEQQEQLSVVQSQVADEQASLKADREKLEQDRQTVLGDSERLTREQQTIERERDELAAAVKDLDDDRANLQEAQQEIAAERERLVTDRSVMETRAQQLRDAVKVWFDGE